MRYFSMFSGVGGFENGIEKAGKELSINVECVGYSEINEVAISIYQKHFKEHKNYGNASTIIPSELPDFDLLVGGFPCQAFSIAGKRKGFDDTRGTLFFEIAKIIREKQPRILLLENVKGLLSHDEGRTFGVILSTLDEVGYDVQWNVLNSKNYGVPQSRERVFIIGHLRGTSRPKVFPLGENCTGTIERSEQTTVNTITAGGHSGGMHSSMTLLEITKGVADAQRIYDSSGIARTLNGEGGGQGAKTGLYTTSIKATQLCNKNMNGRRQKDEGDPSFTLDTTGGQGVSIGYQVRRLTPIECEKLQGFPIDWTKYDVNGKLVSDTQRYKCMGNAVTTNVITAIMKVLLKEMEG